MWPNPQETTDLVTFTGSVLNGIFHFLFSVYQKLLKKFINEIDDQIKAEFNKKDKTCINFEPSLKLRWCHARDLMDHLPYHIEISPLI